MTKIQVAEAKDDLSKYEYGLTSGDPSSSSDRILQCVRTY